MNEPEPSILSLLTRPRLTTLLVCLLVTLAAGTNYAYSAYAPQLGKKLHLTHTQLNMVGLGGNIGVYASGPIIGKIVDKRGPRPLLTYSVIALFIGYYGTRAIYNHGTEDSISSTKFGLLVLLGLATGTGGNAGLIGAVNTTAKSFPDSARATATGVVISGFGLSALVFSTLAHTLFPGDTSAFLLLLSLGTSIPMIVGLIFMKAVPHVTSTPTPMRPSFDNTRGGRQSSQTPLLRETYGHDEETDANVGAEQLDEVMTARDVEMSPGHIVAPRHHHADRRKGPALRSTEPLRNVHGTEMFKTTEFWILFLIISLLSGTGLMWINNAGSVAQALYAKASPIYDEETASQFQAIQVSTVSAMNCAGRIIIGLLSDFTKDKLGYPRSYCVCVVAAAFVLSQLITISIEDVNNLWVASAALGVAYGGMFGLFPTVTIDWFGLTHFSENWGVLCLAPLFGGNAFSVMFGRNLDAHDSDGPPQHQTTQLTSILSSLVRRAGLPSDRQCYDGRACYVSSIYVTTIACTLALALSIWAAMRDRRQTMQKLRDEVLWEQEEEDTDS